MLQRLQCQQLTSGVCVSSPAMEVGSSSGLDSTLTRISSMLRHAVGDLPVATYITGPRVLMFGLRMALSM